MEKNIESFNNFLIHNFVDPSHSIDLDLESIVTSFETEPLWLARALVIQQVLSLTTSDETKQKVLKIYADLDRGEDFLMSIESARAAAVFEEPELSLKYLDEAQSILKFHPQLTGAKVRFGPHQTNPSTRLCCFAKTLRESHLPSKASSMAPEYIPLESPSVRFTTPEFLSQNDLELATGSLTNAENLILLLLSAHTRLSNPASTTSVVNEQALPFIRRVTESTNRSELNFILQRRALYDRSILELKDITELERGTVQLMKLGNAIYSQSVSPEQKKDALLFIHQLLPLPIVEVDEQAARRLVAMSDFGNAIPIYKRLNKPLDTAICLTAVKRNEEALELLQNVVPETSQLLMLRADISSDPELWQQAWVKYSEPKAKLRLARKSIADGDPKESLNHLRDLLLLDGNNYDALLLASKAAMALDIWEPAVSYLRKCLAINDDDAGNWANLSTALLQCGQPELAHHAIKQSIRVNQNSDPNLATWSNFTALSSQLKIWEDVLVGLSTLSDSAHRGSAEYIAKVSGVMPRLVKHFLEIPYTASTTHKQLLELFTVKLHSVVSSDDPMLARLTAQVQLWAGNYQAGLKSYMQAVNNILKSGADFTNDPRAKARLQLYSQEATNALAKFGDMPGRIDGSKALPNWQAEMLSIERAVLNVNKN